MVASIARSALNHEPMPGEKTAASGHAVPRASHDNAQSPMSIPGIISRPLDAGGTRFLSTQLATITS
jgi:hypothetical protein